MVTRSDDYCMNCDTRNPRVKEKGMNTECRECNRTGTVQNIPQNAEPYELYANKFGLINYDAMGSDDIDSRIRHKLNELDIDQGSTTEEIKNTLSRHNQVTASVKGIEKIQENVF